MWIRNKTPGWLLEKLSSETHSNISNISAVMWGIWFARNQQIWENKVLTPAVAVEWSLKQIVEWREAQNEHRVVSSEREGSNREGDVC